MTSRLKLEKIEGLSASSTIEANSAAFSIKTGNIQRVSIAQSGVTSLTANTSVGGQLQIGNRATFQKVNITNAGGDGYGTSTVTLNFANSNHFDVTMANNITLANPSNISNTQSGCIFLTQDGTGSRTVTFGSYWRFPSGSAPSLSTSANAQDRLDYVVKSSNTIHASVTLDLLGT